MRYQAAPRPDIVPVSMEIHDKKPASKGSRNERRTAAPLYNRTAPEDNPSGIPPAGPSTFSSRGGSRHPFLLLRNGEENLSRPMKNVHHRQQELHRGRSFHPDRQERGESQKKGDRICDLPPPEAQNESNRRERLPCSFDRSWACVRTMPPELP